MGIALALETLAVTAIAFVVAVALAELIGGLVEAVSPQYLVLPAQPATLVRAVAVAFVVACAGALIPMREVSRIDPALVFRS